MSTSNFARNLKALRDAKGITQDELSEAIGISQTSISQWESQGVTPRKSNISLLCDYFQVDPSALLSDKEGAYAKAHGLDKPNIPAGALAPVQNPRRAYAPLYGRVHAGEADEPDMLDDAVPLPAEVWERHRSGYFLEVEGTCMDRVYPPGCFVFIDPDRPPQDGSIAVVSIDGADHIMRRLKLGNSTLMLVSESNDPQWEDLVFERGDGHDVSLVGTVVWFQAREEME